MTLEELKTLLESSTGYDVAMEYFEEPVPSMPFLILRVPDTSNFGADDKVYNKATNVLIELWTHHKDVVAEGKVEGALSSMFWNNTASIDEGEICYRTIYEITI